MVFSLVSFIVGSIGAYLLALQLRREIITGVKLRTEDTRLLVSERHRRLDHLKHRVRIVRLRRSRAEKETLKLQSKQISTVVENSKERVAQHPSELQVENVERWFAEQAAALSLLYKMHSKIASRDDTSAMQLSHLFAAHADENDG